MIELKDFFALGGVNHSLAFTLLRICFLLFIIMLLISTAILPLNEIMIQQQNGLVNEDEKQNRKSRSVTPIRINNFKRNNSS